MVLVGGAVLIGRHGDSMTAESPTAPAETTRKDDTDDRSLDRARPRAALPRRRRSTTASGSPMKDKAADQPDEGGETPPTVTPEASGHGATTTPPPARSRPAPRATRLRRRRPVVEHAPTHRPEDRQTVAPVEPRPPAPPPAHRKSIRPRRPPGPRRWCGRSSRTRRRSRRTGQDRGHEDEAEDAPQSRRPKRRASGAACGSAPTSIDQLVKQCQAAAARGDCAAARALAARIATDDAEAYRARVSR